MPVEIDNAKEEIKEVVEKCIRCGMCNSVCPLLRVSREEWNSPRGFAILLDSGIFEKFVCNCTLCRACEINCPLDLKLCDTFIKARKILINSKNENTAYKKTINNLEKTGNIFGLIIEKI